MMRRGNSRQVLINTNVESSDECLIAMSDSDPELDEDCIVTDSPKESRALSDDEDKGTTGSLLSFNDTPSSVQSIDVEAPDADDEQPKIWIRNLSEILELSDTEDEVKSGTSDVVRNEFKCSETFEDSDDEIEFLGTFECSKPVPPPPMPRNVNKPVMIGNCQLTLITDPKDVSPPVVALNRTSITRLGITVNVGATKEPFNSDNPVPGPSRNIPAVGSSPVALQPDIRGLTLGNLAPSADQGYFPCQGPPIMLRMTPTLAKPFVLTTEDLKIKKDLDIQLCQKLETDDLLVKLKNNRLLQRQMLCYFDNCGRLPHQLRLSKGPFPQPHGGRWIWHCVTHPYTTSVLTASIFEAWPLPLVTVMKMVYHWAVQSSQERIFDLIKVDRIVIKSFFAFLRCVCTAWLHEAAPKLGGDKKRVEMFIVSWTFLDVDRKSTLKILGVYDPERKLVRLKVLNNIDELFNGKFGPRYPQPVLQEALMFQILWALSHWVDKSSIIVTTQLDPKWYEGMGYDSIERSEPSFLVNYMAKVERMFPGNLAHVISLPELQGYLDELCWREHHGSSGVDTYSIVLRHLSVLTTQLENVSLFLRQIQINPFIDCSVSKQHERSPAETIPELFREMVGFKLSIDNLITRSINGLKAPAAKLMEHKKATTPLRTYNRSVPVPIKPYPSPSGSGTSGTQENLEKAPKRPSTSISGGEGEGGTPQKKRLGVKDMEETLNSCFVMLNEALDLDLEGTSGVPGPVDNTVEKRKGKRMSKKKSLSIDKEQLDPAGAGSNKTGKGNGGT